MPTDVLTDGFGRFANSAHTGSPAALLTASVKGFQRPARPSAGSFF